MAPSTSPALAHDTACSALRPPNTTATLILRCSPMHPTSALSQPQMVVPAGPPAGCHARFWLTAQGLQGHVGVGDQVLGVFEADGEADRARVDAGGGQSPIVELAVRGRGDVRDLRMRPAQGR